MLDGNSFLRAGWVQGLKLHLYQTAAALRFVVMGKVSELLHNTIVIHKLLFLGEAFPKNVCDSTLAMGYP